MHYDFYFFEIVGNDVVCKNVLDGKAPMRILNFLFAINLILDLCFLITAMAASIENASNTFNVVLLGFVDFISLLFTFTILNYKLSKMGYGLAAGSGVVTVFLFLMNAVYWGEMSKCQLGLVLAPSYSCINRHSMRALAIFSTTLSLSKVTSFYKRYLKLIQDIPIGRPSRVLILAQN